MKKNEDARRVYKVQTYLTPHDYADLEKLSKKMGKSVSLVAHDFIKGGLNKEQ